MRKTKVILSSILSLVLCVSLIIGGTFALFTSESKTNIAVTSGKVDVQATLEVNSLYSPTKITLDGTVSDAANAAGTTFANGGTVKVDGAEITLTNMVPGDKVVFAVTVTNKSTVEFMQRTVLRCIDEDKSFFDELLVGISDFEDSGYTYYSDFATAWEEGTPITGDVAQTKTSYISIEMPACVGNKWQDKTCKLVLNVNAVQGNTEVTDPAVAKVITMADAAGLAAAINAAADGDVIFLTEPAGTVDVAFTDAKEITVRGYKIDTLNVDAENGTIHLYNNANIINGKNVAQHSLYLYGNIENVVVNDGRIVIESTANINNVTVDTVEGAKVTVVIPETQNGDETVVANIGSININAIANDAEVFVRGSKALGDISELISGEGKDDVKTESFTGAADSFNSDDVTKTVYISDAFGLRELAEKVNAGTTYEKWTVYLTADIDLANEAWTPIGTDKKPFNGKFDAQGYKISNLLVDKSNTSYVGLFGCTKNGEIKNLTVENATVKGYLAVGVVAGSPYTSKYTNVTVCGDIKVDGFSYVGTVGGRNAYAGWTDVTVSANEGSYVKAESDFYRTYVGGAVGFMGEGKITFTNVSSNIDVYGSTCDVGGLVGIAHYDNSFINCSVSGDVFVTEGDADLFLEVGGIAGVWKNTANRTVTFENCEFTGNISVKKADGTLYDGKLANGGLVGAAYTPGSAVGTLIIKNNANGENNVFTSVATKEDLESVVKESESGAKVTVELPAGDFKMPSAVAGKDLTISGTADTVIDTTDVVANTTGANIAFDGVSVKFDDSANYKGFTHSDKVVYKDCTIYGQQTIYAPEAEFINCKFVNMTGYNVWTYGASKVTFTDCEFTSGGRAILVYNEFTDDSFVAEVILNNCKFYSNGSYFAANPTKPKAAVETGSNANNTETSNKYYIEFNNCTVDENYQPNNSSSALWGNKNSMDKAHLTVKINNVDIDINAI